MLKALREQWGFRITNGFFVFFHLKKFLSENFYILENAMESQKIKLSIFLKKETLVW